uniref:Mitochondrial ribonuclease P catalytic subunit n=1 Tax=Echeneis naucrates TaxID=173247 RepID=A0A665W8A7_ECHNA
MCSKMISKVRLCLKPLKPFLHQGSSALVTPTPLCKPSQLAPTARSLSTKDINPNSGGRQAVRKERKGDGQDGLRYRTIRHKQRELWEDAEDSESKSFTVGQRTAFPKSVFSAGTAKRTAEIMKRKAPLVSVGREDPKEEPERRSTRGEGKIVPPDRPLSVAEWRKLKESFGNPQRFDIMMIGALFTSGAELSVAKSLLTFVAMERGTLSYELLLRYLTLCVSGGHDTEVFEVYDIMRESFSSLETGASTLFIKTFSRTDRWREAVSLLHQVKKVFTPSSRNYGLIIAAAVLHGDLSTAWTLYDELIRKGLNPHPETWDALFKGVRQKGEVEAGNMSQSEHQERLLGILLYMRNNQIYPKCDLASSIKTWFESLPGQKWTGSWTRASPTGLCRCCGSALESIQLTVEEYHQLKHRVMTDIIQGRDVFNKTTPELLEVVSELERQGLSVLVLGRKHMLRPSRSWERRNMNLIQDKAHCFFTENISEDDPFLLYATLHSGNHCQFVSRDLMRDHKACLPDGATRRLFFKWQRGHQLVVDGHGAGGRVRFQSIFGYDTIVQTSGDSWHLPYDDTQDRSTYEVPQLWLCLTKKH